MRRSVGVLAATMLIVSLIVADPATAELNLPLYV